ncbi:Sm domain-containing protein [Entamoeba marina]
MSSLPWHATASLLEDVDHPFYCIVRFGEGYQNFSGILRTFDIQGNITLSDVQEHIYYNGFKAHKLVGKTVTIFGDSIVACGLYDKNKLKSIPTKAFNELEREYKKSVQFK